MMEEMLNKLLREHDEKVRNAAIEEVAQLLETFEGYNPRVVQKIREMKEV